MVVAAAVVVAAATGAGESNVAAAAAVAGVVWVCAQRKYGSVHDLIPSMTG